MVLATTMLVGTAVGPVDIVLLMGGKSVWNLFNTLVALTLNVVLNLILIPRFGIVGAALAWSASILFNNLAPLLQVWSSMRLHPFGRAGASAALAAVTCYGGVALLVRILLGPTLEGFLVSGLLATGLYVVLIWRSREGLELAALRDALRPRAQAPEPAEVLAR
jgi:O-antigen/teichoic acid export membrane protein